MLRHCARNGCARWDGWWPMARLGLSSWPYVPWPAWVKGRLQASVHEMTSQPHPHPAYREHQYPEKSRKINSLSRYDVAGQLNSSRALTWPAGAMGRRLGPGQQCRSHTERQACDGLAQSLQKTGASSQTPQSISQYSVRFKLNQHQPESWSGISPFRPGHRRIRDGKASRRHGRFVAWPS